MFGDVNKQLQKKQEQLQHLESLNTLHDFAEDIALLRKEINELLDRENGMWWQRSRAYGCSRVIATPNSSIPLPVKVDRKIPS